MHQGTIDLSVCVDYPLDKSKSSLERVLGKTALTDEAKILIYVVDDDASVREALRMLLKSADMEVKIFEAGEDILKCISSAMQAPSSV